MKLSLHSQDRETFLWSVILQETQRLRGFLPFWRRKIKVFVSWYREINGKFKEKLEDEIYWAENCWVFMSVLPGFLLGLLCKSVLLHRYW